MPRHAPYAVAADVLFDGEALHPHAAVLVEDEHIAWAGRRDDLPVTAPVRTLPAGTWLAPGLVDIQVNGGGDVLLNDTPTARTMRTIATAHRALGTTSLLPTLISDTPDTMRMALAAVAEMAGDASATGVVGLHLEGPFLSPERPGAHNPAMLRSPGASDVELLVAHARHRLVMTLAPEVVPAGFVRRLASAGIRVCIGHSMATYAQAQQALAQGASGFTHLFNAMRPLHSREPGLIAAALETADTFFGMIVDGHHVHPAMLKLALRSPARPILVSDAMPPVGGVAPAFHLNGRRVATKDGRCVLGDGTLAGAALSLAAAVRNSVRDLGVPLEQALRYATLHPACFLGLENHIGVLKAGARADMVVIAPKDVRIAQVCFGGAWLPAT